MSPIFWMASGAVGLVSVLAGAGLGNYASGKWQGGLWRDSFAEASTLEEVGNPRAAYPDTGRDRRASGPTEPIVCKGCGPTLAERRTEADMGDAYALGDEDPALRAYEADADQWDRPEPPARRTASAAPYPIKEIEAPAVVQPATILTPAITPEPAVTTE